MLGVASGAPERWIQAPAGRSCSQRFRLSRKTIWLVSERAAKKGKRKKAPTKTSKCFPFFFSPELSDLSEQRSGTPSSHTGTRRRCKAFPLASCFVLCFSLLNNDFAQTGAASNKINGRLAESIQEVVFLNKHIVSKLIHTPIVYSWGGTGQGADRACHWPTPLNPPVKAAACLNRGGKDKTVHRNVALMLLN